MNDITNVMNQIENGDPTAADQLLPLVYDELRKLARQRLSKENPGQTLQATALVPEAYLRLVGGQKDATWDNRGHFFAAAAEAMRRILIDQARRKQSKKHGGDALRVQFDRDISTGTQHDFSATDLLDIHVALTEFETIDPERASVVKLHFFAGLSLQETADALGISLATAKRRWTYARAWLFGKINDR
jgi:RNA polymerase sigma factor (TIGR02999 family)